MDSLDYNILKELMCNGRSTWAELAIKLGKSSPAIADRVRRLEEKGFIKGYAAIIDSELVGYQMTAFISLSIDKVKDRNLFLERISVLPEVQECHHVAGNEDFLLKIRCQGTNDLDRIISQELRTLPGVFKTRTIIVLNTHKDTPIIPITNNE
ncbi:Lrp/AsnC family transcriptional regulator [Bacillus inaquosorum]|uniref:Lrp/AsnC family transcriptional regulator n=1 Tax=Bacillus inaquosorum TaxID=483913 RepID=UPI0022806C94|nr:Lrp/AsnC family transcriptional regulator [Bacillus inaquosorum]MCY7789217.1 Lrp/AsnC family transcriptional regulator [Bacillus inaquosorum]MCY8085866.1 Lrp/AsnC family transcriptional regulator [Bacillus inaquosorum]MCY8173772.1 Lrp/AsnC family transcriptional regulator [Bacillus inaquosorum]MCY8705634.1 Lrp/AsnC family transcriptional regulator [Bacillus inaquosorum]MCY8789949.1 Lrp/AsnC family transcriptional regulator [Bacillus inaquosorum]